VSDVVTIHEDGRGVRPGKTTQITLNQQTKKTANYEPLPQQQNTSLADASAAEKK